eukprot:11199836-Lingulodinium_polyedra.AAC.1
MTRKALLAKKVPLACAKKRHCPSQSRHLGVMTFVRKHMTKRGPGMTRRCLNAERAQLIRRFWQLSPVDRFVYAQAEVINPDVAD